MRSNYIVESFNVTNVTSFMTLDFQETKKESQFF